MDGGRRPQEASRGRAELEGCGEAGRCFLNTASFCVSKGHPAALWSLMEVRGVCSVRERFMAAPMVNEGRWSASSAIEAACISEHLLKSRIVALAFQEPVREGSDEGRGAESWMVRGHYPSLDSPVARAKEESPTLAGSRTNRLFILENPCFLASVTLWEAETPESRRRCSPAAA